MVFYDSSWKDFPDNVRITGEYIVFYQGGPIYHCTNFPGPVAQSSDDKEYNSACNSGMSLEHFRIINNDLLKNYPDVVT